MIQNVLAILMLLASLCFLPKAQVIAQQTETVASDTTVADDEGESKSESETESEGEGEGEEEVPLPNKTAEISFKESSFYTDVVATALITFPREGDREIVMEEMETLPDGGDSISILSVDFMPARNRQDMTAVIRFLPLKQGLIRFPAMSFASTEYMYQAPSVQIAISQPKRTELMRFEMIPEKKTVYAGQPLRIDVSWRSEMVTNRVRTLLCSPEMFQHPDLDIVIPRCTAHKDLQMGMPFGGRRLIVERKPKVAAGGKPQQFGDVAFSMYVRFNAPGKFQVPKARLECAYLKGKGEAFSPYASYYNNGLFESFSSLESYERLFVESKPFEIDVRPLPEKGQTENFSGLFLPCDIDVSLTRNAYEVGQMIDVNLRVTSAAPHGMLALPYLPNQRSLRGSFRVSEEVSSKWYANGSGFKARMRPLSTDIQALPSIQIQVFDPEKQAYAFIQTDALPLKIKPQSGLDGSAKHYFDVRTLGAQPSFTNQPEGIWHQRAPGRVSLAMHTIIDFLSSYFYPLLLAGPVLFWLLLGRVKESRRRALNPVYKRQAEAYERLLKAADGSSEKWAAFQAFVAATFAGTAEAWTTGDTARHLKEAGISDAEIQAVLSLHARHDAAEYANTQQTKGGGGQELNQLASRLRKTLGRAAIYLLLVLGSALAQPLMAGELQDEDLYQQAARLYERAAASPAGLPETQSIFTQAALKYEAAAAEGKSGEHPGYIWLSAGNSWFKAGELGRAISCYRQAKIYRPFDQVVTDNLAATRALTLDVVEASQGSSFWRFRFIPLRWLSALLIVLSLVFWAVLLAHIRYQNAMSHLGLWSIVFLLVANLALLGLSQFNQGQEGVVIVGEIYGRKGPSYNYEKAFHEPLHDGLEFELIDQSSSEKGDWLLVELADERQCWIPAEEVRLIKNTRL